MEDDVKKIKNIRAKGASEFLDSPFYKDFFEPFINTRIVQYKNINEVFKEGKSDESILRNLHRNKGRYEVLSSLLKEIGRWALDPLAKLEEKEENK